MCSMPNLNPVPDCVENMAVQQDIIDRDAVINVLPYASITKGEKGAELVDFEALADKCFAFSDDGKGVQKDEMMKEAMLRAKALGKPVVAHCEDESLLYGGYIHDGEYARLHGHRGICSESEWGQVARDVELVKETGVQYHVCHISTKDTLERVQILEDLRAGMFDVLIGVNLLPLTAKTKVRLLPPLVITDEQIDQALSVMKEVIEA